MTAEDLALKIERVDARSRSNTHRIEEIERNQSALTDLALSVKELATKQGGMEKDLTVVKSDIKTLTGKPAKRWEELVEQEGASIYEEPIEPELSYNLGTIPGAVLAYALGQLGL